MKKLLSVLAFVCAFYFSNAQESDRIFKPFRVDLALGYAIPSGSGSKMGACFIIEPKYAIQDQIQVGLRMETALMVRGVENANSTSGNVSGNGSYTATGDYYFTTNRFRPFAGAGLGYCMTASLAFDVKDVNQNDINYAIGKENKMLALLRTGFEFGHGRLSIEYNYVPKSVFNSDASSSAPSITVRNSYISFNLGVAIGGGRYKK